VKVAVCGLPGALSITEIYALYEPATVGENVTWIEQLAPGARLGVLSQPLYPLKRVGPSGRRETPVMVSTAVPVLASVTDCFALTVSRTCWPNERVDGKRFAAGAPAPVPLKLIVWGLPLALSVMETDALRDPVADGVNVTLIVQLAPAPTLVPQLFVWAKSPEFVPLRAMLDMLREALPVFESITLCAALVEPVPCWPNFKLVSERLAMGADGGGRLL